MNGEKLTLQEALPEDIDVEKALQKIERLIQKTIEKIREIKENKVQDKKEKISRLKKLKEALESYHKEIKGYLLPVQKSNDPKYKETKERIRWHLTSLYDAYQVDVQGAIDKIEIEIKEPLKYIDVKTNVVQMNGFVNHSIRRKQQIEKRDERYRITELNELKEDVAKYEKTMKKYFAPLLESDDPNYSYKKGQVKDQLSRLENLIKEMTESIEKIETVPKTDVEFGKDFVRGKQLIEKYKINYHQEKVEVEGKTFLVNVFENYNVADKEKYNPQTYIVLHDSEDTSFDTGLWAIGEFGGRLITLENNEDRYLKDETGDYVYENGRGIDPNVHMWKKGKYFQVAEKIISLIELSDQKTIFSLHDNYDYVTERHLGNFDLNEIAKSKGATVYYADGTEAKAPLQNSKLADKDIDNALWISGTAKEPGPEKRMEIAHYLSSGMNVVYEYVEPGSPDGSLSNWAADKGALGKANRIEYEYYNPEIDRNKPEVQKYYLENILEYKKKLKLAPRGPQETSEHKETVDWNRKIIPTFDDGPEGAATAPDIMRTSYKKGVNNFEFYWLGARMLTTEAKKMLGIKQGGLGKDVPRSTHVKPGHWIEWIDKNKPQHMTRTEFIRSLIKPEIIQLCKEMMEIKHPDQKLSDFIGFHGITHEASKGNRHLSRLDKTELQNEIEFFQELIRISFNDPTYTVTKARTPYGAGLEFEIKYPGSTAKYKKYNANLLKLQGVEWNAWHTDTEDWENNGNFSSDEIARDVSSEKSSGQKRILMHERYYAAKPWKMSELYDQMTYQKSREYAAEKPEIKLQIELGRWNKQKINNLLAEAQKITDPNKRMEFIINAFKGTPFKFESQLPILKKDTMRVRLASFDCCTFVYYMLALNVSKNFNEFVKNLRDIRYKDPDASGIDNRPDKGNIFDFTYNVLYENAVKKGILVDVTEYVAGKENARDVSTTLGAWTRDVRHDKKRQVAMPKINLGKKVSAKTIPKENIPEIDKSKIKTGDIILFTKADNKETIVGHVAIALNKNGKIYFIHASKYGGVTEKKKPIEAYIADIERFKGFTILRPKNVQQKIAEY